MKTEVKMNKNYYLREILQGDLQPCIRAYFWHRDWVFQQNSSPAHKAKVMQGLFFTCDKVSVVIVNISGVVTNNVIKINKLGFPEKNI